MPEERQQEQAKAKKTKVINCTNCGKPTKKLRRYYRDGKHYCSKRCWRDNKAKSKVSSDKT